MVEWNKLKINAVERKVKLKGLELLKGRLAMLLIEVEYDLLVCPLMLKFCWRFFMNY